jgi:hypothetical protein
MSDPPTLPQDPLEDEFPAVRSGRRWLRWAPVFIALALIGAVGGVAYDQLWLSRVEFQSAGRGRDTIRNTFPDSPLPPVALGLLSVSSPSTL